MSGRKISYVVHQFLPRYFTGTEQYVFAVARSMQRRGHDVEVIALEPDFAEQTPLYEWREEEVEGLKVQRIRYWYHLDRSYERMEYEHPFIAERFRRHLERRQPDLVHAFHLRYLGADLLAETRALGIPSVVHLMDFWFLCPAVTLMRRDGSLCDGPPEGGFGCIDCVAPDVARQLERDGQAEPLRRLAMSQDPPWPTRPERNPRGRAVDLIERPRFLRDRLLRADRIIAPSRFLRDRFLANGYPAEGLEVCGYGVDPERLAGVTRSAAGAGTLRCGFIGSIAHHKGTDLAVEAVLQAGARVSLSVRGRTEDFAEFSRAVIDRADGDPRVTFDGPFERDQLGAVLASLDVLVVPSRWYENTPFVVLEAFAAGVPVVASDLGGLSELIEDGVNGELFRAGDAADLAARLTRLQAGPERLQRYRQALPSVKTIEDNADEIAAIYAALWSEADAARTIRAPH